MALPQIPGANYPTPTDLRDTILRSIEFAYDRRGLVANVLPSGEHYVRAEKYAERVAIAIANNQIAFADADPLTATGDALETLAGIFGVTKRAAAPAAGHVTITSTATVTIPAEFLLSSSSGAKYETTSLGTYASGASVEIIATDGGDDTNLDSGEILTWDSASIGALNRKATVTAAGLTDGADADDDERLRDRLLAKLSNPAVGGNSAHVVELAEDASASVEHAYCYPAARGPGSYDVAITADGGNRTLASATITTVRAAVLAEMPGQADLVMTTVTPQYVDIVLAMDLPLPQNAGGVGGGWSDADPWPAENVKVSSYVAGTGKARISVSTTAAAPSVGASIGIWDPDAEEMNEYSIATVTLIGAGPPATYDITVQDGFNVDPTDAYISAGAVSLVDYATTFAEQVAALGPGEKSELPEVLARGTRYPSPDVSSPAALTSRTLAALTNEYDEIVDADWGARYATGTTTALTEPDVPATTADPPKILVLKYFAIRAA